MGTQQSMLNPRPNQPPVMAFLKLQELNPESKPSKKHPIDTQKNRKVLRTGEGETAKLNQQWTNSTQKS